MSQTAWPWAYDMIRELQSHLGAILKPAEAACRLQEGSRSNRVSGMSSELEVWHHFWITGLQVTLFAAPAQNVAAYRWLWLQTEGSLLIGDLLEASLPEPPSLTNHGKSGLWAASPGCDFCLVLSPDRLITVPFYSYVHFPSCQKCAWPMKHSLYETVDSVPCLVSTLLSDLPGSFSASIPCQATFQSLPVQAAFLKLTSAWLWLIQVCPSFHWFGILRYHGYWVTYFKR